MRGMETHHDTIKQPSSNRNRTLHEGAYTNSDHTKGADSGNRSASEKRTNLVSPDGIIVDDEHHSLM